MSRLCSPNLHFREQVLQAGVTLDVVDRHRHNNAFLREWVTPFIPWDWVEHERVHPEVWYWRAGSVRNWRDGEREFPYLHFMNFKEHRCVAKPLCELQATWGQRSAVAATALTAEVFASTARASLD
jgi:hypothetical protein